MLVFVVGNDTVSQTDITTQNIRRFQKLITFLVECKHTLGIFRYLQRDAYDIIGRIKLPKLDGFNLILSLNYNSTHCNLCSLFLLLLAINPYTIICMCRGEGSSYTYFPCCYGRCYGRRVMWSLLTFVSPMSI